MRFLGEANFDHRWRFALGFRWIGDVTELQAAWIAATTYAAATSGLIFDHHEGRMFSAHEAQETVRDIMRDVPEVDAILEEIQKRFFAQQK